MAVRSAWSAPLAVWAVLVVGSAAAASAQPSKLSNPASDALLKLKPAERAEKLARSISRWCIGTETFLMGIVSAGPGAGNAYWSLRCADGTAWAVQVDLQAGATAIDCESFKQAALGKECFKKF